MTNKDVIQSGIAILQEADPTVVHGVAIGAGDITQGMSGKRTLWPASALRDSAEQLTGKPLVRNHPGVSKDDEGLRVDAQPPVEDVIGEVTDAQYRDDVGLLFEAEVDNESIATQIERGRADVSPVVSRSLGEFDEEQDAHRVESITGFRDLGVVSEGASRSNSIQPGAATAMMAEALSSAFGETATGGDDGDDGGTPQSTGGQDEQHDNQTDDATMSDEETISDAERELLAAVDDPATATDVLQDYGQFEQPRIVEQDEFEGLQSDLNEAKLAFADVLSQRVGLDADKIARNFSWSALREEFEDDEGDIDTDALVQTPETGQPDEDEVAQESEALSREEREEKELLETRIETFEDRGWEAAAQTNREKLAELTGDDSTLEGDA